MGANCPVPAVFFLEVKDIGFNYQEGIFSCAFCGKSSYLTSTHA